MQCILMEQPAWLENEPVLKNNPRQETEMLYFLVSSTQVH